MKRIVYLILLVLIIISCEKEVDIPIEYTQPKLVVNGLFNTDSLWNIEVSASKYIFDATAIPLINDAQVTVTNSGGNSILLTNQGNGIYTSLTEKPEPGEVYTLDVSHSDYDNVRASNQLPGEIVILNIDWLQQAYVDGELYRRINITFQDSPNNDYYLVRIKGAFWHVIFDPISGLKDSILAVSPMYFFSQNAAVENSNSKEHRMSVSFTDEIFNGNQYTIGLLLSEYYFTGEDGKEEEVQTIYLSMSKISEEYYWYETSYQAYISAQDGKLFAQPVQVYTNIENGLGIFAGYSAQADSIIIE
ncbi:MAG: DUF4249 domain-containing protein [Bacteroidota bacterium]